MRGKRSQEIMAHAVTLWPFIIVVCLIALRNIIRSSDI